MSETIRVPRDRWCAAVTLLCATTLVVWDRWPDGTFGWATGLLAVMAWGMLPFVLPVLLIAMARYRAAQQITRAVLIRILSTGVLAILLLRDLVTAIQQ